MTVTNNSEAGTTASNRVEVFKREIADLQLKTNTGGAEKAAGIAGGVLMAAAGLVALVSFIQSSGKDDPRDQNELIILSLLCVVLAVIGSTLLLWNRVVRFWRFWMLRQMYENQAHLDQLVERLKG